MPSLRKGCYMRVIYDLTATPIPKLQLNSGFNGTLFLCRVGIKFVMMKLGQVGRLRRICGACD